MRTSVAFILLFLFQASARIEKLLAFHRVRHPSDLSTALFAIRGGGLFGKGDKDNEKHEEAKINE
jgi:hypothetical protein